ncbi:MAG: FHA domain-containing protein [Planctomycetota bacterium]
MPPEDSWTIGSDPSCDLVVDSKTVSGQHCRLVKQSSGFVLEDLGSTNGTFINGQKLTGRQPVRPSDTITLGQSQPMPWPSLAEEQDASSTPSVSPSRDQDPVILTIGRGSNNVVVLKDANVSTQHARLTIRSGEILLEDLDSTNGTSVGTAENKIRRTLVTKEDQVFFGSSCYTVGDLLHSSRAAKGETARPSIRQQPRPTRSKRVRIAAVILAIGLFVVFVGFAWRLSMTDDTVQASKTSETASRIESDSELDPRGAVTVAEPENDPSSAIKLGQPSLSPEQAFARAFVLIVSSDPQRETPFRVGTGFAMDAETVVTSAAVISAVENLKENGFSETFLFSPETKTEFEIVSTVVHPTYQEAEATARAAQRAHDVIFDELESKPPTPEAFEAVREQLLSARENALQAMDRKSAYDVAVIKTNGMTGWLDASADEQKLRPNQRINIVGYAFDIEDPFFDKDAPFSRLSMQGRISGLIASDGDSTRRLIGSATSMQTTDAFLGSAVLNSQRQVIGVYSRPTALGPTQEVENKPQFDAALFRRVGECQQ